ncbi:DUF4442 domain-containing protein, partial [Agromyces sp. NPDC055520]
FLEAGLPPGVLNGSTTDKGFATSGWARDYIVWDTRGEIEFVKPGRGVLTAHFAVSPEKTAELRERARGGAKVLEWFETEITDRDGDVVARVRREVYVREKKRVTTPGSAR